LKVFSDEDSPPGEEWNVSLTNLWFRTRLSGFSRRTPEFTDFLTAVDLLFPLPPKAGLIAISS